MSKPATRETHAKGRQRMRPFLGCGILVVLIGLVGSQVPAANDVKPLTPEAVKALVARCLGRLGEEVERVDGRVDKFMGDNVMAIFGAPVAHEDDPERAVRAAVGMQAAMSELNQRLLADLRDRRCDALIAYHVDRLTRRPKELEEFLEIATDARLRDVRFVSGVDLDVSNGDGLLVLASDAKRQKVGREKFQIVPCDEVPDERLVRIAERAP